MNILIINAFGTSPTGKIKFNSFLNLIKKTFKKISEHSGIDNFNYIIRTPSNLGNYIFNYYSNPTDETSESQNRKNFNSLDMVFIDGIEIYSPWKKQSHFLSKFIELCELSNKVLYAGGVALEILIYYLSIGSINEYNIINSKGEIKALEEISKIPLEFLKGIKRNEIFLDFVTGDLLEYKNNEKSWEPIMNIGLHHQNSAEKFYSRGKFVLSETFKGKDYYKNEFAVSAYYQEIKIKITRQYVSHYLVENCPIEFIGVCSLEWFPHLVNVTSKKLQFKTICQSQKGSIVIEHENSIGVAFHSQEKFKDSVKILENFINKKFNEVKDKLLKIKNIKIFISNNTNNEISPIFKMFKANDDRLKGKFDPDEEIIENPYSLLGKVTNSCLFNRTKKVKHEAKHVGQGINNREMIFVENNFINHRTFYRFKRSKTDRNNFLINNNKKSQITNLSPVNNQKRISFISNAYKGNKSMSSINELRNKRPLTAINKKSIKRDFSGIKRKQKLKELTDIKDNNDEIEKIYFKNKHLKLKTYRSFNNFNNTFEISKNNNVEENNFQISQKKAKNFYNTKKKKEDDDDFENYESKYPRLPTSTEFEYLLYNVRNKLDLNDNISPKKNCLENDKKEIFNYSSNRALFLTKLTNTNIKSKNNNDDTKNSKKKRFILKSSLPFDDNKKKSNNKDTNLYKTYRPVISQKYDIYNKYENF